MSDDRGSISSLGLYIGTTWHVTCHQYPDKTPILRVDAGEATLLIAIAGRDASDGTLEFARTLAREAQAFAAEVERLHAASAATHKSADQAA